MIYMYNGSKRYIIEPGDLVKVAADCLGQTVDVARLEAYPGYGYVKKGAPVHLHQGNILLYTGKEETFPKLPNTFKIFLYDGKFVGIHGGMCMAFLELAK